MIGIEFLDGQGLGNQLFCLASVKSIARDSGYEFGTVNQSIFAHNIHNSKGMYFMDVDLGSKIDNKGSYQIYNEKEERIWIKNSIHDLTNGCYITGVDDKLLSIADQTLIYGNLQAEYYFRNHMQDLKKWFKIKKEFDTYKYTQDNLCILNMRGGEYKGARELFLKKDYWINAMNYMKRQINSDMKFMVVTDDVKEAKKIFPDIPVFHFDIAGDYVTIKNAKYLILSNSSFACFPAFTSETCKIVIAPKYWARHNVSTGYWASEQNIYSGWMYMDRDGKIFTSEECIMELCSYKKTDEYRKIKGQVKPTGVNCFIQVNLLRLKGYLQI